MSISSKSTAFTPKEYIKSEVDEQTIPPPIPFWENRTSEINQSISSAFQAMAQDTKSEWTVFNGSDTYDIGGIKEHKLMRKLIQGAPERRDFYALDIGAGNFQWGQKLAQYLNAKKDIPKDVTIHIIGVRGERNLNSAVSALGQCKLYEFGQFQVETLGEQFQKLGLQLANKVDLVVSRWCFRHLVDPVGTFAQTYDLLRPKTGHLLIDGFFFLHENDEGNESIYFNVKMIDLFLKTRAPFLRHRYNFEHSLDHFVVNKPDDHPCHLPKQYLGTEATRWGGIASNMITRFKEIRENNTKLVSIQLSKSKYYGDKGLYERLRQQGILHDSGLVWGPLLEKDINKNTPPIHMAIANEDEVAIDQCLKEGCDINESDSTGATPLHLSIKQNNYNLFSMLLERGALTKLVAEKKYTPLHLAVRYDFDGRFVKDLINAGVNVNIIPNYSSPLDGAIKHKNVKAVELLLKAKATLKNENRRTIENDSTFISIQYLLPK